MRDYIRNTILIGIILTSVNNLSCQVIKLIPTKHLLEQEMDRLRLRHEYFPIGAMRFELDPMFGSKVLIETKPYSRLRPDSPRAVKLKAYFDLLNSRVNSQHTPVLRIVNLSIIGAVEYDMSTFGSQFDIKITYIDRNSNPRIANGFGSGPLCKRSSDGNELASPAFIENTNLAFLDALLKAIKSMDSGNQ